ncbi:hypothetical protein GCM10010954_32650 [Halobacillus andaensis]|uniref:Uncharacterized protein n=1 Tax=Halobacillus andaensis TaxID=1176239 RepID=A0A917B8D4_HALAA|nr:hypothetical protein [Halobacillus andaensis]MBP2005370.1 hypothetical protein [Halobacillus andaensis]GGF30942.1 hypothetical protein GCM10010954_32650 [Halobacillus andaensis]
MSNFIKSGNVYEDLVTRIIVEMGIGKADVFLQEGLKAIHKFIEIHNEANAYQLKTVIQNHFRSLLSPSND